MDYFLERKVTNEQSDSQGWYRVEVRIGSPRVGVGVRFGAPGVGV